MRKINKEHNISYKHKKMIKKYCMCRIYPIITLFAFSYFSSCTYDYFEDENNYVVYVPKADKNKTTNDYRIEDLAIYIYNDNLQRERYSYTPFDETPRSAAGNFHFKLYPGAYNVYTFTNLSNINFLELNTQSTARFDLLKNTDGYYLEPSAIQVEYTTPTILFPGPIVTDIVPFEKSFTGRICIAFKNLTSLNPSLTMNNISKIKIEAEGVGVSQYFSLITDSIYTRSSRYSDQDKMLINSEISANPYKDFEFGLANNYLPSPIQSQSTPIRLDLRFINNSNQEIHSLFIDLVDSSNNPKILHTNETIVVEVDGDNVHIISLDDPADWEGIVDGGGNIPGGGIEV